MSSRVRFILSLCLLAAVSSVHAQRMGVANNPMDVDPADYLEKIQLPPGFSIELYATGVENARQLAVSDSGVVFVGSRGRGTTDVYALVDDDNDHKADRVLTVASGLNTPNGVALHDGDLYIAEISRIVKLEDIEANLDNPPEPQVVNDNYPTEGHHGWKFIAFGPDDKLYVPVGAPCNTCETDEIHAVITRLDPDGSNREVYAKGIRNTVGFDWHPQTGHLWFTDNGRDMWGNDRPPEELNRVTEKGQHFGFPYRYGKDLVDSDYETDMSTDAFTPPQVEFPAHNAGLGMRFYTGEMFPAEYHNDIFVAFHGSWNRSVPDGYFVARVNVENGEATGYDEFATGWLQDEKYWGRPVDVAVMADGSLLVSDDHNGVVYRISYQGN